MSPNILDAFGLNHNDYHTKAFGSGLINSTWEISGPRGRYILQCINKNVFKNPQDIADNLSALEHYLKRTSPGYLFTAPLPALNGKLLVEDSDNYYRLLPFIGGSHTVDFITQGQQAYEAAKQFGKFTRLLNGFDPRQLKYTLPDFHNLNLRVEQFKAALANADKVVLEKAAEEIRQVEAHIAIADIYKKIVSDQQIPLRVIHHDTKINNVLFDDDNNGLCVIDLDTVMPGYYISDVGDMMRTYLSAANEEERDLDKIKIREDYFIAIYKGYMEEMGDVLTPAEKSLFFYSGKFMIYMQAIRFLADFLNGDIYYHTSYPGHNLLRTQNQLTLLKRYLESENSLQQAAHDLEKVYAGTNAR
ncbi:aminoglycoside phosphotransferase family protein [Mucilaginibacter sp. BJC16-A38]|uniref:phosphotransferase enzyme family protein n=1 Tax=Mucilaginibacter phenanthrenivorans TaxID=1234842 RepID=UPI002157F945|nr:aminoglycoside phosphotransferase family protein [Mucilaginibacter phenanthrenivorans]MCR8557272.1 aminoglycoside phosphotransferase family protein [Mucilaginibacter phenanthrenivorans]